MPAASYDEIVDLINDKKLQLLTLDTSIFGRYANKLESPPLKNLDQFSDTHIRIVLSDVVLRELADHMEERAGTSLQALRTAIRNAGTAWSVEIEESTSLLDQITGGNSERHRAESRIGAFLSEIGADVARARSGEDLSMLVSRYFERQPPFAIQEKRKHEFPDAIALLSLERYARDHKSMMLAVSSDGSWKEFASQSDLIICIDDLTEVFPLFRKLPGFVLQTFVQRLVSGELGELRETIEATVAQAIESSWYSAKIKSAYDYDPEMVSARFDHLAFDLEPVGTYIARDDEGKTHVFNIALTATAEIAFSFHFIANNRPARYRQVVDTKQLVRTFELPFWVAVTIKGDPVSKFVIEDVEVTARVKVLDFGKAEPFD